MKFAPFSIFVLIFLCGLEFLVQKGFFPAYLVPAPTSVLQTLWNEKTTLLNATLESAESAVWGLSLSLIIGVAAGVTMAIFPYVKKIFYPAAVFFQTVPIIAIAPLMVIWFGYGKIPVVLSALIVSIFPILSAIVSGIANTEKDYLTLSKLYRASKLRTFWVIQGPSSLPYFAAALRSSMGLAVVGAVVGEFMSGTGLGGLIEVARVQYRVDLVFAGLFCITFLGLVGYFVSGLVEERVRQRYLAT